VFITLTYPDECAVRTLRERTTDKYLFLRYMEKHLGARLHGLWRVEWKPRKSGDNIGVLAPHYHFMVFNVPFVAKETLRSWWREILDVEGPLSTDVRKIENWKMASCYIGKYVAKESTLDITAYRNNPYMRGRHWGHTRKELLPLANVSTSTQLTEAQAAAARSYAARKFTHYDEERGGGFTLFGQEHAHAFQTIREVVA